MIVPKEPGHYWARWRIKSPGTAEEDDPPLGNWEVVQVFQNCIDEDDDEYLRVAVPGVARSQAVENFFWGECVSFPKVDGNYILDICSDRSDNGLDRPAHDATPFSDSRHG